MNKDQPNSLKCIIANKTGIFLIKIIQNNNLDLLTS